MTEKDIKKLENIARVLGSAMADLQELSAKYDVEGGQPANRKRQNLKQQRKDKYRYQLESGKFFK
ncbi:MAG: hypothetical protein ACOC2E_06240 [Bacteroidota bacterium]